MVAPRLGDRVARHRELHRAPYAVHGNVIAPFLFELRQICLIRLLAGERRTILVYRIGYTRRKLPLENLRAALCVDDGERLSIERGKRQGACRSKPCADIRVLARIWRIANLVDLEDWRRHVGVVGKLARHPEVYAVTLLHRHDFHEDVVYHFASRQVEVVAVWGDVVLHAVRLWPIRDDTLYRLKLLRKRFANLFHDVFVQGDTLAPYLPVRAGALRLLEARVREERGVFVRRAVALNEYVFRRKRSDPEFRRSCGKSGNSGNRHDADTLH